MDPEQILQQIINIIKLDEEALFSGAFNESLVRSDLASRPGKRSFYIENFTQIVESIDNSIIGFFENIPAESINKVLGFIGSSYTAGELKSRAIKNKAQAQKMLDYVRSR